MSQVDRPKHLLNPVTLPLVGKHLIEASAGTGKTFNITRLYLRVLLEKQLPIEQILVMTFSNAATEEIRGRVADTLHEAILFWQERLADQKQSSQKPASTKSNDDPVYAALFEQYPTSMALQRLQAALLVIDEASIYTIHGFCQQVLSTYAFDTGVSLNAELQTDSRQWLETATKDWFRSLRSQPEKLSLLSESGWHTPDSFLAQFFSAITKPIPLLCRDTQLLAQEPKYLQRQLESEFAPRFNQVLSAFLAHKDELYQQLVPHKDGKKHAERESEWAELLNWLEAAKPVLTTKPIDNIMHGRRYTKNESVKTLMEPLKALKADLKKAIESNNKTLERQHNQQPALQIVYDGVLYIKQAIADYKRQFSILEFDDLVLGVAHAVKNNPKLASELAQKYPVALVDEFQDTDAAQYQMLECVYGAHSSFTVLLMIGDPKQAIYGFRGGDIFTYLKASQQADHRWHMDTNWRSTGSVVNAYNQVFNMADFDFNIEYLPVNATEHTKANQFPLQEMQHLQATHNTQNKPAALQFVYCNEGNEGNEGSEENQSNEQEQRLTKAQFKILQANWVAQEILRLFSQVSLGEQPIESKDIAILVRSASEAGVISQALQHANITHVYLSNQKSVYASTEAQDVYTVLRGIFHNTNHHYVRAALTCELLGQTAQSQTLLFVEQNDDIWDEAFALLGTLRHIWITSGILALLQHLIDERLLLIGEAVERQLTNYQHLAELLQSQSEQNNLHFPDNLLNWFAQQIEETNGKSDVAIQRLEKDENAVQIVTQHKSKGLEYPIVFIPFASDYKDGSKVGRSAALLCQYYNEQQQQLVQQIGDTADVHKRMIRENNAEAMRLLYVAITRAMHRCYMLISPFDHSEQSALGRALNIQSAQQWNNGLSRFCEFSDDCTLTVVDSTSLSSQPLFSQKDELNKSAAKTKAQTDLTPPIDTQVNQNDWRLLSFSALMLSSASSTTHWRRHRAEEQLSAPALLNSVTTHELPMRFSFPKGAAPGNVLHDILEEKDFTSTQWQEDAHARIKSLSTTLDTALVLTWLNDTLAMPITLSCGREVRLNQLGLNSTLREAEFYYPLNHTKVDQFLSVVSQLRGQQAGIYLSQDELDGMMHGFIDLIFEYQGKYYVADYKSTYMGDALSDYSPQRLKDNMIEHNYDIQALIYSVALHRYLTKSLPDYNLSTHFGGAVYLYLRGMSEQNSNNEGAVIVDITPSQLEQLNKAFSGEEDVL